MSTISYSSLNSYKNNSKGPFAAEIDRLGRVLDKYTKFYWRGEDMWETYNTFITNNGSALKFINGPSFSNTYSSPQYDHAVGNLTGVKFSRMQVSFSICTYAVTAEEYRKLIMALGPYEIDYLSFEYDKKMCYLVKTTNLKEGTKTVIGVDKDGNDLYLVENTLTFEVQGEQCAIAQRQYIWNDSHKETESDKPGMWYLEAKASDSDILSTSEIPYGIVNEINFIPSGEKNSFIKLEIAESKSGEWKSAEEFSTLYQVTFNEVNYEWRNTQNSSTVDPNNKSFSIKYDSASGLIYFMYAQEDYKTLNLLTTNEYGDYLIKDLNTTKVKIDKNTSYSNIIFRITYSNVNIISAIIYGRAKTILI